MPLRDELIATLRIEPPPGWARGHVTITGRYDDRVAVEALRRGAFAIHETISGGWRLSHAPTGLQIWTCDGLDRTLLLAARIEPLADWDGIKEMLPSGTELYKQVRPIINEIDPVDDAHPM